MTNPQKKNEKRNAQRRAQRAKARAAICGDEPWHGTVGGYSNHCCRCDACRSAYRDYVNEWRVRPDVAERRRAQARVHSKKPETAHRKRANTYGLTPQQLHDLLAPGVCAACGTSEPGFHGWAVDHDHRCCPGKRACGSCVRGILCQPCNIALGVVNDDLHMLRSLVTYIERTSR